MFWLRYSTRNGSGDLATVEAPLALNPTDIDYPDFRNYKQTVTQDGGVIVQRPLRDSRPRKWIWRGYGPSIASYAEQWALLQSLEKRARVTSNLPAQMEIWEDVSGVGGFARTNADGSRLYTKVQLIQVARTPRTGGGPVAYDSTVTFQIDDATFSAF
jgi:hypothetical protein